MNNHNSIVYYRFTVNNLRKHNTKDNTIYYGYLLNITQKNNIQRIIYTNWEYYIQKSVVKRINKRI